MVSPCLIMSPGHPVINATFFRRSLLRLSWVISRSRILLTGLLLPSGHEEGVLQKSGHPVVSITKNLDDILGDNIAQEPNIFFSIFFETIISHYANHHFDYIVGNKHVLASIASPNVFELSSQHRLRAGLRDECPLGFEATRSEGRTTDKVSAKDEHGEIEPLRKTKHRAMKFKFDPLNFGNRIWWVSVCVCVCVCLKRTMTWVWMVHRRDVLPWKESERYRYPDILRWCCIQWGFSKRPKYKIHPTGSVWKWCTLW